MIADSGSGPHSAGRAAASNSQTNVFAVLGPTNTGKTHYAVERMLGHESGMIGAPLRLLAREIYDRIVDVRGPRCVALMTGEEKIIPDNPSYWVCTVEAMPVDRQVAFLAVDEIQLAQDPERGHTFTDRLLHARGSLETLFLGASTMRGIIRELVPGIQFLSRSRLSQLSYAGEKKVSRLPRRSAVVAFSADQVYGLAELLRRQRGGAAVVMGALSPRTRNAQVALYQSGDVDFIVATDAIGMGLNMDIDHVAFAARRKFDGRATRDLRANELGQIAGRAGRFMNDGTFGVTGECPPFEAELIDQIENHRFDPVRSVQWRSPDLDYSSVDALISSLETPPTGKGLMRPRAAIDLVALKLMATNREITDKVTGEELVRTLWSVCQIPDFQQTMMDNHVRLLTNIFLHLMDGHGHVPEDWLSGHVERLDNTDGDIDTLSNRIAHIRTWTFVSNRAAWLARPDHWQDRTREIEDRLSDALHERLTQAFIDRRTSVLMKRLHQADDLNTEVDEGGEVTVEGEYVGRLLGFRLVLDPRSGEAKSALETKALRSAATRTLEPHVKRAADRLISAPDMAFSLQDSGTILFEGASVGRLVPGPDALTPATELITNEMIAELLGSDGRARIQERLARWTRDHIKAGLAPLLALREAVDADGGIPADGPIPLGAERKPALDGLSRGVGYQLVEHLGAMPRHLIADQLKEIANTERARLRALGVRFGEFSVYLPILLKPAAARLLVLLWGVHSGRIATEEGLPAPPQPGLTSVPIDPAWTEPFMSATGYRRCGRRAVRIDILERLGNLIRKQRFPDREKPEPGSEAASKDKPAVEVAQEILPSEVTSPAADDAPAAQQELPSPDTGGESPPADAAPPDTAADETAEASPSASADAPASPSHDSADGQEAPQGAAAGTDTAQAPANQDASAEEAAPPVPPGAFVITAEMLSLAGCSSEDFAEILKGLRYRPQTEQLADGTERTLWRAGRARQGRPARGERPPGRGKQRPNQRRAKGAKGDQSQPQGDRAANSADTQGQPQGPASDRTDGPKGKRPPGNRSGRKKAKHGQGGGRHPGKQGGREREADPNSPFAVLASLKETLKSK